MRGLFEVVPIEGQAYEGRQWGFRVLEDGGAYLDCHTGGTGPCWNVRMADDEGADWMHICDLDATIAALIALRESEAHRANVARWEP